MLPFALLYAMDAVIEMMQAIGPERIERRVMELAGQNAGCAARRRREVAGGQQPALRFADRDGAVRGRDAPAIARELQARKVLVAARHGNLRVSPHFYNDEADLARLAEALS
jgi:cysteine desulfurase / selenocysteine lyase